MHADMMKNDFLDEAPFSTMNDPSNEYHFDRFRDAMSKVYAFDQYKADKPSRPRSDVAVVTSRNITRYRGDLFYGFGSTEKTWDGAFAWALSQEGIVFDLMDPIRYAPVEDHRVIYWGMAESSKAMIERVRKWLISAPSHVLICSGYQPTRRISGLFYNPWNFRQDFIEDPNGGKAWGLPVISALSSITEGTIDKAAGPFSTAFKVGDQIALPGGLYSASGGNVLLSVSGHPLVSAFTGPGGSKVIYLHYRAGERDTLALDRRIASVLSTYLGSVRVANSVDDIMVHSYSIPGGSSHVLWARKATESWQFIYDGNRNQRLQYANPGFNSSVTIPVQKSGDYILYESLTDTVTRVNADTTVRLQLNGALCAVYYVLPTTPAGVAQLDQLRSSPIHKLLSAHKDG
jgi:hypothetical protein